jgi:hypothetical protein
MTTRRATATATADPYGMTNKKGDGNCKGNDNGNGNGNGKSRFPAGMTTRRATAKVAAMATAGCLRGWVGVSG